MIVFRSKALGLGMVLAFVGALICLGATTASAATPRVQTIEGFKAPGTPEKYNKVRVVKYGSPDSKKVLVLNPGTSAGGTFFGPFANALTKKLKGWQVWAIERRENLLEDHSYLEKYANGEISNQETFDYYLGWITDPSISPHFTPKTTAETEFAKNWGMNVAVHDTRKVVRAAKKGGRTVVMGGHSLGGSITTAYATWDFNGKAGAKGLSGLVFIDGAGANSPTTRPLPTAEEAQANVDNLNDPAASPFITLVPPFPWIAGVFNATGSTAAVEEPDEPSIFASWVLAPADLKPPVPATNAGQYGYAVDSDDQPRQPGAGPESHRQAGGLGRSPRLARRRARKRRSSGLGVLRVRRHEEPEGRRGRDVLVSPGQAVDRFRRDQQRCGQPRPGRLRRPRDHGSFGEAADVLVRHLAWWRTCRGCDPPARRAVQGAEELDQDRQADQDVLTYRSAQRRTRRRTPSSRRSFPS